MSQIIEFITKSTKGFSKVRKFQWFFPFLLPSRVPLKPFGNDWNFITSVFTDLVRSYGTHEFVHFIIVASVN